MRVTRRRLLGAAAVAATAPFAGCSCESAGVTVRPSRGTRVGRVDGTWVLDGGVTAEFTDTNGVVEAVEVVVFDAAGSAVVREDLGSIPLKEAKTTEQRLCPGGETTEPFRLEVPAYPYRIALRGPALRDCDADVTFQAATLRDAYDPGHAGTLGSYWGYEAIPCPDDGPAGGEDPTTTTPDDATVSGGE